MTRAKKRTISYLWSN